MFPQFAFFKPAFITASLLCMPSSSPANLGRLLPAPIRGAVQQDVRPAVRTAARPISDPPVHDRARAGEGRNSDGGGLPSYTGGLTEAQMRALD
jgi:hypothetical protein